MIILALSGTGRIGSALQAVASRKGYTLIVVSDQRYPSLATGCHHEFCNLDDPRAWAALAERLKHCYRQIDVIVDIVPNADTHSTNLIAQFCQTRLSPHVITVSSTFVYDRTIANSEPLHEGHRSVAEGQYGSYVDNKLRVERLWRRSEYLRWTLLRPHHLLGAGYHLGCSPPHNRDPQLLDILERSPSISLAAAGRQRTSFVHVADVAECILALANNPRTYRQTYNLAHPRPISVRDYYLEVANRLGVQPAIREYPRHMITRYHPFWALTSYDQSYTVNKLRQDAAYSARRSFAQCVSDSLESYRPSKQQMLSAINLRLCSSSYTPRISLNEPVRP